MVFVIFYSSRERNAIFRAEIRTNRCHLVAYVYVPRVIYNSRSPGKLKGPERRTGGRACGRREAAGSLKISFGPARFLRPANEYPPSVSDNARRLDGPTEKQKTKVAYASADRRNYDIRRIVFAFAYERLMNRPGAKRLSYSIVRRRIIFLNKTTPCVCVCYVRRLVGGDGRYWPYTFRRALK